MGNFTKLLLFLGQQLFVYHRRIIFIEELRQIYTTDQDIIDAITDPIRQGWISPAIDKHHFEITPLAEVNVLSHWDQNVYITGEVGGETPWGNYSLLPLCPNDLTHLSIVNLANQYLFLIIIPLILIYTFYSLLIRKKSWL